MPPIVLLVHVLAATGPARACHDTREMCAVWASQGECSAPAHITFMAHVCPDSCLSCGDYAPLEVGARLDASFLFSSRMKGARPVSCCGRLEAVQRRRADVGSPLHKARRCKTGLTTNLHCTGSCECVRASRVDGSHSCIRRKVKPLTTLA